MTTAERVRDIVSHELQVGRERVLAFATPQDLGADSLAVVGVVMAIEEEFEMEIPDDDVVDINTIGELIGYVAEREARQAESMPSHATPSERQATALERIAAALEALVPAREEFTEAFFAGRGRKP